MSFANVSEVSRAYESRQADLHARCWVRIKEVDIDAEGERKDKVTRYETTVGRALLSEILPRGCPSTCSTSRSRRRRFRASSTSASDAAGCARR